jgi:ribose 1,5-bisphosphate isomerase
MVVLFEKTQIHGADQAKKLPYSAKVMYCRFFVGLVGETTMEPIEQQVKERIQAIRDDREHGSRWLVREAIMLLRDLAQAQVPSRDEHMRILYATARDLATSRPAMAALVSAVGRVLNVQGGPPAVAQAVTTLLEEQDAALDQLAIHAKPYIKGRLMTCSISGTVLAVLTACREQIEEIFVLEGRPRYEGRETALTLAKAGCAVTVITDAQADIFLPQCRAVVVGADSVLAQGDVLNKAGTSLLGWAARGHSVPFYVLCETLKISPQQWSDDSLHLADNLAMLEEKEGDEVWVPEIQGICVRNFYFDRTPHSLISQWISEQGALSRQQIGEIAASVQANIRHLATGYVGR